MINLQDKINSDRPKANFTSRLEKLIADENEIVALPMCNIIPYSLNGDEQPFKIDNRELISLTDSIQTQGQLTPVIVRQTADGKYQILSGNKRYMALKRLSYKYIKSVVVDADDATAFDILVQANIQRKAAKPSELASVYSAYLKLSRNSEKTLSEICGMFDVSKKTMYRYANMLRLNKGFYPLIDNKQINVRFIEPLGKLTDEQQSSLLEHFIENKLSSKKLNCVIDYFILNPQCSSVEAALANCTNENAEKNDIYSSVRRFKKYKLYSDEEINDLIIKLLEREINND